jgi:hypothetical protein
MRAERPAMRVAAAGFGFYKLVVCRTGEASRRGAARLADKPP